MLDILFDPATREIVMSNNDFSLTSNPSIQNGAALQYSRCANLAKPMAGIGMEEVINADGAKATFEMNRWKAQAYNDGATFANWKGTVVNNTLNITIDQSYL